MSVVTMKEMLKKASLEGYLVPAFNVFNMEMLLGILEASAEVKSPVIVQLSMGGREYVGNPRRFLEYMKSMADDFDVPVAFNHDHCPSPEDAIDAIEMGFSGVMFDGSHLDFDINAEKTRQVVEVAEKYDIAVEAELGRIPGFEDLVFSGHAEYTDPELALRFVQETGCTSLAVSAGTSHGGVLSDDYLPFDFDVLKAIHEKLPGFPLVLHGAASLPLELIDKVNGLGGNVPYMRNCSESDISKCGALGVCKANMDVDNFLCFTEGVRRKLLESPELYDPRVYLSLGKEGFKQEVIHKFMVVSHTIDKAW